MPDIMMCGAGDCPKSQDCYRHKDSGTEPSWGRQAYWLRDDASPVGDACDNFWNVSPLNRAAYDRNLS